MDLYLVRHAIAFNRDAGRWPDDSERPLTPDGEQRFRRAARGLRILVPSVRLVMSSPFPRAWRTAELLTEEAGWPAPEPCPALEAGRSVSEAMEALRPQAGSESVALVGHEPNLSELASTVLTGSAGRLQLEMRKGGVALVRIEGDPRRGSARLGWLLTPRALRSLAR